MGKALGHRRYLREESAKATAEQTILTADGITKNPNSRATRSQPSIDYTKKVTCPFCLGLAPLRLFLLSTKKGFHRSLGKCHLCGDQAQLATLANMRRWTAKDYAKFVYMYPAGAFFKKCRFQVWKDRLKIMRWTQDFWSEYKLLKGEDYPEDRAATPEEESLYKSQVENTS